VSTQLPLLDSVAMASSHDSSIDLFETIVGRAGDGFLPQPFECGGFCEVALTRGRGRWL
jgi:hypothetical protein